MPRPPSLARERLAWAESRLLVGVDEAGRGPLAGPVVAAAVVFPPETRRINGIRDSKTLPREDRETLALRIRSRAIRLGVGAASCREIDRLNIRVASALAMRRAVQAAFRDEGAREPLAPYLIVIDGLPLPEVGYSHEALIDGDAHCYSIAAASIVAKTVRDRIMRCLASRHPAYGWQTNVGYGTPEHLAGLASVGPTRHHRMTFAPCLQTELFAVSGEQ
ncbi:MAG TPA: ribonuclease HII [Gemmatimonadales bacterium]|nr:ribonuclease HII [Gemmatimonadales bacterium]